MRAHRTAESPRHTGCWVETIRFYASVGLLPALGLGSSGHCLYAEAARHRLTFIRRARSRVFDG